MAYGMILDALGDPTRRRILEALRAGPMAVSDLALTQTVSRPAVSQHLKTLEAAGLVSVAAQGNRRVYAIRGEAIGEVRAYLDGFWTEIMAAYSAEIHRRFGN
ncbi:MAG: metalloregulator ArsR/SmtB family transcription factor [bacterium]